MSQNIMILEYIKRNGSITPMEAVTEFGCMRLSGRIYELKQMGVSIKRDMETGLNRFGNPVRYARYSIERGSENV